nr:hypothetical protein Itr_chr12CG00690 [Ipomoea trifida]
MLFSATRSSATACNRVAVQHDQTSPITYNAVQRSQRLLESVAARGGSVPELLDGYARQFLFGVGYLGAIDPQDVVEFSLNRFVEKNHSGQSALPRPADPNERHRHAMLVFREDDILKEHERGVEAENLGLVEVRKAFSFDDGNRGCFRLWLFGGRQL